MNKARRQRAINRKVTIKSAGFLPPIADHHNIRTKKVNVARSARRSTRAIRAEALTLRA
jgi:hypothetical protein